MIFTHNKSNDRIGVFRSMQLCPTHANIGIKGVSGNKCKVTHGKQMNYLAVLQFQECIYTTKPNAPLKSLVNM